TGGKIELHGDTRFETEDGQITLNQLDSDGWIIVGADEDPDGVQVRTNGTGGITMNSGGAMYLRHGALVMAAGGDIELNSGGIDLGGTGGADVWNPAGTVVFNTTEAGVV